MEEESGSGQRRSSRRVISSAKEQQKSALEELRNARKSGKAYRRNVSRPHATPITYQCFRQITWSRMSMNWCLKKNMRRFRTSVPGKTLSKTMVVLCPVDVQFNPIYL